MFVNKPIPEPDPINSVDDIITREDGTLLVNVPPDIKVGARSVVIFPDSNGVMIFDKEWPIPEPDPINSVVVEISKEESDRFSKDHDWLHDMKNWYIGD